MTRPDWQRLLPLVAQVQRQHPDLPLSAVLTDRVASARHLPAVLAWRLWRLLPARTAQPVLPGSTAPPVLPARTAQPDDRHRAAVRTLGGPAAVRAALAGLREVTGDDR